jgi:hypothetical protein
MFIKSDFSHFGILRFEMTDPSSDDMLSSVDAIYDSLMVERIEADELFQDAVNSDKATAATTSNPPQLRDAWSTKSRRRKAGSLPYSTDLQRRRKAELRALTLEAQTLDSQVSCLRSAQQTPPPHMERRQRAKILNGVLGWSLSANYEYVQSA